jgi:hypothetical protein
VLAEAEATDYLEARIVEEARKGTRPMISWLEASLTTPIVVLVPSFSLSSWSPHDRWLFAPGFAGK